MIKKKVVWIVNEYNFPDSVNTRQTNLCHLLNQKGYDCFVISGSTDNKGGKNRINEKVPLKYVKTDESKGFIIKTSDYKHSYKRVYVALQFQHRLWRFRKKLPRPDVIVSDFAGIFGNIFLKWKRRYDTKIIFDILDLWPEGFVDMGYLRRSSFITKFLFSQEHKSYAKADGIIFSFQGGKDYIVDKGWSKESGGDVDVGNIGYLNNGVDLATIDKQRTDFILDDMDLDSNSFKVVYLGSISEFNGIDVLVETARVLKERKIDNIIILVFGYGNQEDHLKQIIAGYGLDNIKFKGKLEKKYAMNLLSRSDINIFTFKNTPLLKYGTSPNKLFMYFASGKPVLSMIKPAYDLVEGKNAGISVNNNPEDVADAIIRFCNMDKSEYNFYCHNSRKVAEEYDYKNLVNVLIDRIEGAH